MRIVPIPPPFALIVLTPKVHERELYFRPLASIMIVPFTNPLSCGFNVEALAQRPGSYERARASTTVC